MYTENQKSKICVEQNLTDNQVLLKILNQIKSQMVNKDNDKKVKLFYQNLRNEKNTARTFVCQLESDACLPGVSERVRVC